MNSDKTSRDKTRFLGVLDGSYFQYFTIFGCVADFQKKYPEIAAQWIKPVDECDQDNLPDLINCMEFRGHLKKYVMKRLETVENIIKSNFQDQVDCADRIDMVFAQDDSLKRNFRLDLYPQYKANRLVVKRQYQLAPIKQYMENVLYPELELEGKYGYRMVRVPGAEGDDVIATVLMKFADRYLGTVLISSDRDFLQIPDVREFDLFGKEAKRELGGEEVSAEDFLLGKILMGDKSDNIKQVFFKCGPKTALGLTKDRKTLDKMLAESSDAANRFLLNKKIISFTETPKELTDSIVKAVNEKLYSEEVLNGGNGWGSFMDW